MGVTPATEIKEEIVGEVPHVEELRDDVNKVAQAAAQYAKSIAPVYAGREYGLHHPGEFRDSIYATDAGDYHGLPAAQVRSDLEQASYIEYGAHPHGGTTPEHATFAKTVAVYENTPGVDVLMMGGIEKGGLTDVRGWKTLDEKGPELNRGRGGRRA